MHKTEYEWVNTEENQNSRNQTYSGKAVKLAGEKHYVDERWTERAGNQCETRADVMRKSSIGDKIF